jgi:hypothetical protein
MSQHTMRILIRPRSPEHVSASRLDVAPTSIRVRARQQRVLDFDCECRPLHWYGGDFVSKELTAIAWAWTDAPQDVTCYLLGEVDVPTMLRAFVAAYDQADIVTGHYIRGFDLPLVNGQLTEHGMPVLADTLAHDTKLDAVRRHGMSSSQENWGAMLGLEHPKVQMDQAKWRSANRLTAKGLEQVRSRVVGDVQQHIEMRATMLRLGYLSAPKRWSAGGEQPEVYTP